MTPKSMDSLDVVEMVMMFEEFFDTEIPDHEAERWGSPSEIVDSLERQLSNQRPNKQAASILRKLAKKQQQHQISSNRLVLCRQLLRRTVDLVLLLVSPARAINWRRVTFDLARRRFHTQFGPSTFSGKRFLLAWSATMLCTSRTSSKRSGKT